MDEIPIHNEPMPKLSKYKRIDQKVDHKYVDQLYHDLYAIKKHYLYHIKLYKQTLTSLVSLERTKMLLCKENVHIIYHQLQEAKEMYRLQVNLMNNNRDKLWTSPKEVINQMQNQLIRPEHFHRSTFSCMNEKKQKLKQLGLNVSISPWEGTSYKYSLLDH